MNMEANQKARINRALAKDGEVLRTARGEKAEAELGRYYIVDVHTNTIAATDCDLDAIEGELKGAQ